MNIFKKIWDFLVAWADMMYEYRKYHKVNGMY